MVLRESGKYMTDSEDIKSPTIDEYLLEQKLIEKMGHISSELAHDLRSPLQTIQNAIYLLQRYPDDEQLFLMIHQSISQATKILDDFRDYYKAHILQRIKVDLSKVLNLAFSDIEIPDNIKITREFDQVTSMIIDPSKIALAIHNLIENAIKAMPKGGELNVKTIMENDNVNIIISDTGFGISEEMDEIIYTPFMARQKNGRGLGIPTAKRIIESHGGKLSYESEPEMGTVFTITLPLSQVNL